MPLLNVLHLEDLLHNDLETPIHEPWQGMINQLIPQSPLVILISSPQRASLNPDPFPQDAADVRVTLDHNSAQIPQQDNTRISARSIQILVKIRRADKVNDDVDPLPVRRFEQSFRPVALPIVEPLRRPQALAEINLLLRTRRHVDRTRLLRLAQLYPRDAHTARARMPQDALPTLKPADQVHGLRRGDPRLRDPRRLHPAQLLGLVDQHVRAERDVLGVRSPIREPEDLVVLLERLVVAGRGTEGLDRAAELDTHDGAGLWGQWIAALTLKEVHAVETEGFDLDQGLGRTGFRFGIRRVDVEG